MSGEYIVMDGSIAVYGADTEKDAVKWAQAKSAQVVSRAFFVYKAVAKIEAVVTETKVTYAAPR